LGLVFERLPGCAPVGAGPDVSAAGCATDDGTGSASATGSATATGAGSTAGGVAAGVRRVPAEVDLRVAALGIDAFGVAAAGVEASGAEASGAASLLVPDLARDRAAGAATSVERSAEVSGECADGARRRRADVVVAMGRMEGRVG
jgi:hypothetical protein